MTSSQKRHRNPGPRPQRVDYLIDLRLDDRQIDRDARILGKLRESVRGKYKYAGNRAPLKTRPSLYSRYRGKGFPIKTSKGRKPPPWRDISPWLKVQLGTLVLGEAGFLPFTLRPREETMDEILASGAAPADYLRDAIARHLRRRLGRVPHFYFIIEDLEKDGVTRTRPHVHGCISHQPVDLPITSAGNLSARWRKQVATKGDREAKLSYAKELIREALEGAGGFRRVPRVAAGRDVWFTRPKLAISQDQWVTYAFKNAAKVSPALGERRLVMSRPLTQEARRLWDLIRTGESALHLWDRQAP